MYAGALALFQKMVIKKLGQGHRSVFPASTPDSHKELAFPFRAVQRKHIIDQGQKTLEVCINAGEEPVRTGERGLPEPEDCLFANGLEHGSLRPQGVFIRLV